jgi:hypothetical protein
MTEIEKQRYDDAMLWLEQHPSPAPNSTDRALWDDAWLIVFCPVNEWPKLEIKP